MSILKRIPDLRGARSRGMSRWSGVFVTLFLAVGFYAKPLQAQEVVFSNASLEISNVRQETSLLTWTLYDVTYDFTATFYTPSDRSSILSFWLYIPELDRDLMVPAGNFPSGNTTLSNGQSRRYQGTVTVREISTNPSPPYGIGIRAGVGFPTDGATGTLVTFGGQNPPPGPLTLIHPIGGFEIGSGENRRPTFSWSNATRAVWYHVWIQRNGVFYHQQWMWASHFWTPPWDLDPGQYTWWVAGYNSIGYGPWSSAGTFSVEALPPPVLQSPHNGFTEFSGYQPTFNWTHDIDWHEWYEIYIQRDGSLFRRMWVEHWTSIDAHRPLSKGTYRWWVRAWTQAEGMSDWSSPFTLNIEPRLPDTPQRISPANGATFYTGDPILLQWTQEEYATDYVVQVAKWITNGNYWYTLSTPILSGAGHTSWNFPSSYGNGDYAWRVKARGLDGDSEWSPFWAFTKEPQVPDPPEIRAEDNQTEFEIGVDPGELIWRHSPGATWYCIVIHKDGRPHLQEWMESEPSGLTITFSFDLGPGNYDWWVCSWNPDGHGGWTQGEPFTVFGSVPDRIVTTAPANGASLNLASVSQVTLRWNPQANVQWYRVVVQRDGVTIVNQWLQGANQDRYVLPINHAGDYDWWVMGWNRFASGPWSHKRGFSVQNTNDSNPPPAEMVLVTGGTLATSNELDGTVVDTFYIGRYQVTWSEWKEVRAWAVANDYDIRSSPKGCANDHPVREVFWYDAVKWCNAKSEMEGLTPVYTYSGSTYRSGETFSISQNLSANGYRLPMEAEWEFAARGGNQTNGTTYAGSNNLDEVGWYRDNSGGATCDLWSGRGTWPVGLKAANELGLYDMSGNVWEWCWDRVPTYLLFQIRGGSYASSASDSTVSLRLSTVPTSNCGFRLARSSMP